MKKVLLMFLLVLISSSYIYAKTLSQKEVSIVVPDTWSDNLSTTDSILIMSLTQRNAAFKENVVITKETLPNEIKSAAEYKKASIDGLRTIYPNLTIIDSNKNYLLISNPLTNEVIINQLFYFYIKNNSGYVLIFSSNQNDYQSLSNDLNKIEKSLIIK